MWFFNIFCTIPIHIPPVCNKKKYIWQRIVCWVARFGPTFLRRPGEHPGLSQPNVRPSSHGHGRPKPGRPKPRRPALADPAAGDPSSLGCFRYAYNRFLYISLLQEAFSVCIPSISGRGPPDSRKEKSRSQSVVVYQHNRFLYISLLQEVFAVRIQLISLHFFTTGNIFGTHTIDFFTFLYYKTHLRTVSTQA